MRPLTIVLAATLAPLTATAQAQPLSFGDAGIAARLAAPLAFGAPAAGGLGPAGNLAGLLADGFGLGLPGARRRPCVIVQGVVISGDVRGRVTNSVRAGTTTVRC